MDSIKKHLSLFSPRLKYILEKFENWDQISEIRLRLNAPLSLTSFRGNVTLNKLGKACPLSEGVICEADDLSTLLGAFCGGSVYRFFEELQDSFAVDADGWRMGICSKTAAGSVFLPQLISGINLRIPRQIPLAAKTIVEKMETEGIFSLLICSAPGDGKTTILRSLGALLSMGSAKLSPQRVAVVDEREELFPLNMKIETGLLDVLPSCKKPIGIERATRLFSPQIILCDEIGSLKEAEAVLNACSGGCTVIASAHASNLQEAKHSPALLSLIESGKFRFGLFIEKIPDTTYKCRFHWERFE